MQLPELIEQRFRQYLPTKPYCSDDKTASNIRPVHTALSYSYVQFNPLHLCAWMVFDIDTPFSGEWCWESVGLPVANFVVMCPVSKRYHAFYAIKPVHTTENARQKPLEYLAAIQRTYKNLLNSDQGYAHLITKNPMHKDWDVVMFHADEYELGELQDYVGKLHPKPRKLIELCELERNVSLFNTLRYHAYAVVHQYGAYSAFWSDLEGKALDDNNQFAEPLLEKEVLGIAKSVAKWTWANQSNIRAPKERKLQLDMNQPLETRQSVGAHYTNQKRTENVLERMTAAYNSLLNEGKKATQKAVQEHSGVGIATIKRYWKQVKSAQ